MRWLLCLVLVFTAVPAHAEKMETCTVSIRGYQWKVEKAVTVEERRTGLMLRKKVKSGTGMLFILPAPAEIGMWMKDTLVPLDMVFITPDDRIAYIEHNAEPKSLDPITPPGLMRAVMEIRGGAAKAARLKIGDKVKTKRCY